MALLYHQNSPDEIRRIAVLISIPQIQNFYFTNAVDVIYNANTVESIMVDTPAADLTEAEASRPTQLSDAYRKVVEQIRQAEAYFSTQPNYEEPVIEEENIDYPILRDINISGIRELRR